MKEKIGKGKKVVLALSGGVDSAVSAALLKKQGYEVTCVHMVCWEKDGEGCSSDPDRVDAAKIAGFLDLPLLVWDFTKEYKKKVIDYFYSEYKAGRTPNPDVMCNKEIKFGLFFKKAFKDLKVDFVATGHYARVRRDDFNKYKLLKGADPSKDQSYFLYPLTSEILSKTIFPIGEYTKIQVREIAKEMGLPVWYKPDSQGICFVGKVDIREFLNERIKQKKGKVLGTAGNIIGEHIGAWFYTIGQRHGFRVEDRESPQPLYVVAKDVNKNILTVGPYEEAFCDEFEVKTGFNPPEADSTRIEIRIRHLGELYPVTSIKEQKGIITVKLGKKAFGVALGQSAVFYCKDTVLGGGVIV
ncbi:MAG: tRNA 2-thiouridine(34) synthase MnmA [Patescibacteria group bacterium]|nr:tRNA 2-thiouridine(34) synthase MnmA [Patescibacteria group bacterium]